MPNVIYISGRTPHLGFDRYACSNLRRTAVCISGKQTHPKNYFSLHYCGQSEIGKYFSPCYRSRLRIWSHETGWAVPPRASPLIRHSQAESSIWRLLTGSYPPSRFPRRRQSIPSTATTSESRKCTECVRPLMSPPVLVQGQKSSRYK